MTNSAEATEHGWVIEAGWTTPAQPEYWTGPEGSGDGLLQGWHADHMQAIRFARKQDASKIARCLIDPQSYRIAEHAWATQPLATDPHAAVG